MKLVTYEYDNKEAVGVVCGEKIIPVKALGLSYETMNDLIRGITEEEKVLLGKTCENPEALEISSVKLLAPIPEPMQDVLCLGLNYVAHIIETGHFFNGDVKEPAVYFSKRVNRATADGETVRTFAEVSPTCDYEVELGVIIGKDAFNVRAEDAGNYIFGYTIINDMTLRDPQHDHKQWYFGKSPDGFTPMGPWIVTADEIEYPPRLDLTSRVNGQLRQQGNTRQFIHPIGEVVEELTKCMTLKAGTVIATGTPSGVALGMEKPDYLKPGDVVECTVEKIGSLTVTMI